jgi:hypothetical protein
MVKPDFKPIIIYIFVNTGIERGMFLKNFLYNAAFFTCVILFSGLCSAQETPGKSTKVHSAVIGPSQYKVTCFESPAYCAEEFKRLCPAGHGVGGYFRDEYDHGQITAIITCKTEND